MRKNIEIIDLPAAAVEVTDDQLDMVAGAGLMGPGGPLVCSALAGGASDCFRLN
ncbi:hypothetical protein [Nonomuraea sp. NPDC049480]|uniref:hypothetical protein n=1 Tax=Nonomuraea sp. NPDC049480 TaxID=3364353 RepID=UPI0037AA4370